MELGRLTWIGLVLAAIGWALFLGEAARVDFGFAKPASGLPSTFHADVLDVAKAIIGSGFGLAVVGALQTGFGALNRFFEAVLMRSSNRSAAPQETQPAPAPTPERARPVASVERRPYRMMPDGSVEVETILGTRRFDTMAQAREFI